MFGKDSESNNNYAQLKYKNKKSYLTDFTLGEDGKYSYNGKTYVLADVEKSFKSIILKLWILSIIDFIVLIICGCIPNEASIKCAYVIIPYVLTLLCCTVLNWSLGKITFSEYPLRSYTYKIISSTMPISAVFIGIFSLLTVITEFIYIFINGVTESLFVLLFIVLYLLSLIIACIVCKILKNLEFKEVKN